MSIEKLGAITTHLLTDWLARTCAAGGRINVRPVLDLNETGRWTSTTHPTAMREQVVLRDAHCVFPGCRRDSRSCDLDHITPYIAMEDGGPPGQTHPETSRRCAGPITGSRPTPAWDYKPLDGHGYLWTAPTGHQYRVDPASPTPTPPTGPRT